MKSINVVCVFAYIACNIQYFYGFEVHGFWSVSARFTVILLISVKAIIISSSVTQITMSIPLFSSATFIIQNPVGNSRMGSSSPINSSTDSL